MLDNVQLHLVQTMEEAAELLSWLGTDHDGPIAFDCESSGLSPEKDHVRLVQFGDRHHGWSIPFEEWKGLIREVVRRWDGRWVGHNARFDVAFLRKHGIEMPIERIDDTMMCAHIIDSTVPIGLKPQSARHVDRQAAALQHQLDDVMKSGHYTWGTIPISATGPLRVYWLYAALDTVLTRRLWDHHWPIVKEQAPKAYDIELSVGWVADRMERKGALVDREYASAQQIELAGMYDDLTKQAAAEFNVNLSSAEQVTSVLLADDVKLWKKTGEGAWSLDKFALEGIGHPLVRLFQRRKYVEKLSSTYLRRFLEYSEYDGRIHPHINTLGFKEQASSTFGVVTGRMSMSDPNLQQLPRPGEDPLSRIARNCIVAAPGHTLVLYDFDQIELRIMAHLTKDPGLAAAFASDEDFFVELMRHMYDNPSLSKADKTLRNTIKAYTYATNYGAGNDKLATMTKRPLAEIERLDADFRRAYSEVPKFHQTIQRLASQRLRQDGVAYVTSPLTGRRFIARDRKKLYQLVNSLIQGMAAEIMKTKLLELDAAGLDNALMLVVHDEAIVEVEDKDVSDVHATMRDVMNDDRMLSIPLTSGGAVAKRWAEKQDV